MFQGKGNINRVIKGKKVKLNNNNYMWWGERTEYKGGYRDGTVILMIF